MSYKALYALSVLATALFIAEPQPSVSAQTRPNIYQESKDETNQKVLLPATASSEQYPGLIPKGETVATTTASSEVLVAYDWPANTDRHRRLAKFVGAEHTGLIQTIFERQYPNKWYCLRRGA